MKETKVNKEFIQNRITQIRMEKGLSENALSKAMGVDESYINKVVLGKSNISLSKFFKMCDVLKTSPSQFFMESVSSPRLINEVLAAMMELQNQDMELILELIRRINEKRVEHT